MKLVDLEATIITETEKALLCDFGTKEDVWVPKSIVEVDSQTNGSVIITMPYNFAMEKGLI